MKANTLYVVQKCCAADDDSQPYTPYSFATETGASLTLEDAVIFTSEADAIKGRNNYVVRDGRFKVVTLAEAIKNYIAYNLERSEFENEQP